MTALKSNKKKRLGDIFETTSTLWRTMKKTLTVCSVLLTSVSSALLWGNQTQCRLPPTNTRHLQKEVAQKIHQSQLHHRPVARWTFCRWQTNFFFLIYGLLNRGGPVQEKCQFFWGQYGHNGFLKGQCVILAREVSLSIVWLDLITNFRRNR